MKNEPLVYQQERSSAPRAQRAGRPQALSLGLLALVALLVLRGGSCLQVERSYPAPQAQEVAAAVQARAARVSSLRAETRLSHLSPEGKVKATVRLMAARGGKLRLDAVSPFETPLATLVSNGTRFALIDTKENRYYHGPATPCNLARLLQVVLAPDDVLTILGGSTPVIQHETATLEWDARAGEEVLTLSGGGLRQTIRLDGEGRRWDLRLSEVQDQQGQVLLRIEATDYHPVSALRLPAALKVSQPKLGTAIEIYFESQELNLELPQVAFELPEPGSLPQKYVECGTAVGPQGAR